MSDNEETGLTVPTPTLLAHVEKRCGTFEDPAGLRDGLAYLHEQANVLLPISRVRAIPAGHAVTLSTVLLTRDDCYPAKGKPGHHALHKSALDRIAAAAGVTWKPELSGRRDNGSDPMIVEWREVGEITDLDGSLRLISGTNRQDLREDGANTVAIMDEARDVPTGKRTLISRRKWIVEHAQSKARARAIRSGLGVKSSYHQDDLSRPFVAAKLTFTGDYGDAETNRAVAILAATKALGLGEEAVAGIVRGLTTNAVAPPVARGADRIRFDIDATEATPALVGPPGDDIDDVEPELGDSYSDDDAGDTAGDPEIAERMVELARSKGKLAAKGTPPDMAREAGQMTAEMIRALPLASLERVHLKLSAMPDGDEADDGIPW